MQILRVPLSLALATCALAAKAPTQPRSLRVAKAGSGLAAAVPVADAAQVVEVEEVEVPVLVVVADDEDTGMPPPPTGLSVKCRQELMGRMKNLTMEDNLRCEQKENFTARVMDALERANNSQATVLTARAFTECVKLSQKCADEMAPDAVLKARFSGMAVSSECQKKAKSTMAQKGDGTCEKSTTKAMVEQLKNRSMNGAIVAAQDGLAKCNGFTPPCDFQFAPLLVIQMMQMAQQQQMQMAVLAGLREMGQLKANMLSKSKVGVGAAKNAKPRLANNGKIAAATPMPKKALSLLDVASRIQIVPTSHAVAL